MLLDPNAHIPGELEVLVDVEPRVDDRGDAGVLVADQIRRAPEVVVDDLAEDHVVPRGFVAIGSPAFCQAR